MQKRQYVVKEQILEILDIAPRTYYLWKKEERPIINFLEKYFVEADLSEFLQNGIVSKLETLNYFLYQQTDEFFDYYHKIDGRLGSWRIFHKELNNKFTKYESKTAFLDSALQSSLSTGKSIKNYGPFLRFIENITPPVIWFVNVLKQDYFIIKEYLNNKYDEETVEIYIATFKLRNMMATHDLEILNKIDDDSFTPAQWREMRKYIEEDIYALLSINIPFDPQMIDCKIGLCIINKLISNIHSDRYFKPFSGF